MKKVCIVTAARSEYGVLRWVIDGVSHHDHMDLQLVVTGAHLDVEQGLTVREIEADGYPIAARVDMGLNSSTQQAIACSMARCQRGMADVFAELRPDMLLVLGDRYELLPICSVALVMNIPIAHISGGDVTLGAIDNEVRNAVTMMAKWHFPGVKDSGDNIARMRGSAENIWVVGEPGLDNFKRLKLMTREDMANNMGLSPTRKWVLVTLHPETNQSLDYNLQMTVNIRRLLDCVDDVEVVISKANADFGGSQINTYWEAVAAGNPRKYHLISSLGQLRYLSFMRTAFAVIGNSSSGIVEAPCLGTPVINVGRRQEGRHICRNVRLANSNLDSIRRAWDSIEADPAVIRDDYYGDGHAAERILRHLEDFLHASHDYRK